MELFYKPQWEISKDSSTTAYTGSCLQATVNDYRNLVQVIEAYKKDGNSKRILDYLRNPIYPRPYPTYTIKLSKPSLPSRLLVPMSVRTHRKHVSLPPAGDLFSVRSILTLDYVSFFPSTSTYLSIFLERRRSNGCRCKP